MIDTAIVHLKDYFKSNDLLEYQNLCDILLFGKFDLELVSKYPELSEDLRDEIFFFRKDYPDIKCIKDCQVLFQKMTPEVRRLFPKVGRLLRLLLVSPASACTAESSFCALRRLKTWLRSTMTQRRLNCIMVCHVHSDRLHNLDQHEILNTFIMKNDQRRHIFGVRDND